MTLDITAAHDFMAAHARLLDQHRFRLALGEGDPGPALAALEAYRNPDGGYGWGLEPDLRSPESQPGPALHAFEVFADVAPVTSPRAAELCDWLASVTLPDGGLPFALPVTRPAASAPFWTGADPAASSLQITAIVAANAHRVAAHDRAVAEHPWLRTATEYCLATIRELDTAPFAIELAFAVRLLDEAAPAYPEAAALLKRLGAFVPENGLVHVDGGAEEEYMRPLDFAPWPDTPARGLFSDDVVAADLRRLAAEQHDDGGWRVDFTSYSPAAALEWQGYATVSAVAILRAADRLG
ncbi:hypothetical protein [Prauserella muralis]|uniref:Uncharacterized protein n=1 Tax=Prauserella muralis TaxID=588067 RepID=A0A2V4AZ65_9PSEU|nr:hypothetical protein [Prauserella muralis]PXY27311.1 hypothetical protein BAY60_12755 [Prauserella muralis]TWE23010.1 hypothetical protein FHX69_4268 [Prauserella muralis]